MVVCILTALLGLFALVLCGAGMDMIWDVTKGEFDSAAVGAIVLVAGIVGIACAVRIAMEIV